MLIRKRRHVLRNLETDIEELFDDEEFIEHSKSHILSEIIVWGRNLAVLVAVILFLISIFNHELTKLRAIAYFFGAACYFLEIVEMTEYFRHTPPIKEMFMVYCFGPLYILMGISYLFH